MNKIFLYCSNSHIFVQEFLVSVNVMSNGTPQQKLNWAFELVDVDGNGTADRDEVNQIISVSIYYMCKHT